MEVAIEATRIRVGGGAPPSTWASELVAEAVEDALQHQLVLRGQVAAGAVGDGPQPVVDRLEIVVVGLRAAHPAEQVGEGHPVLLAGDAEAARLDRQEAGHALGHGGHVVVVVEDDEGAAPSMPPTSRRPS